MVEGTRSNLWVAMREAVAVLKPSVVIWENVRGALSAYAYSEMESGPGLLGESYGPDRPALRAAGRVVGDLSDLGYDTQWVTLPASAVGAPHKRERVFVLAHARSEAREFWTGFRPGGQESIGRGRPDHEVREDGPLVERPLLRTLLADELGGGPLPPDVAKERGQTLRLSGQGLALTGHLLPTPQVADATGGHATRSGDRANEMLLPGVAVAATSGLLPTPRASRGAASTETM